MNEDKSFFEKLNTLVRNSLSIRLLSIGFMILILMIPSAMIESLIRERQYRSDNVKREIGAVWGKIQTISGPVLTIPYKKTYVKEDKKLYTQIEYAHFLPENLTINSKIEPEKRHRGIFDVVVYTTEMNFLGNFTAIDFSEWKIADNDILWDEAYVAVGITDMRGIKNKMILKWNDENFSFNSGLETNDIIATGVSTRINIKDIDKNDFSYNIKLRGSEELYFIPLGKTTNVNIKSTWPDPKFLGAYSPENPNINNAGFDANWKVLHLNRNYPQKWLNEQYKVEESKFGVNLIIPVDHYQKSMRSAKYAIMIIAFTFLIFFFVEVLNKKRIHPIQYLLVGLALIIFYTLLLAFSEHISFNFAYLISGSSTIILITLYSKSIFKSILQTSITGLTLVILYAFIFITLQLQDYALLMGSIGLFVVMAIVMYLSKKIDWYAFGSNTN